MSKMTDEEASALLREHLQPLRQAVVKADDSANREKTRVMSWIYNEKEKLGQQLWSEHNGKYKELSEEASCVRAQYERAKVAFMRANCEALTGFKEGDMVVLADTVTGNPWYRNRQYMKKVGKLFVHPAQEDTTANKQELDAGDIYVRLYRKKGTGLEPGSLVRLVLRDYVYSRPTLLTEEEFNEQYGKPYKTARHYVRKAKDATVS